MGKVFTEYFLLFNPRTSAGHIKLKFLLCNMLGCLFLWSTRCRCRVTEAHVNIKTGPVLKKDTFLRVDIHSNPYMDNMEYICNIIPEGSLYISVRSVISNELNMGDLT